LGGLLLIASLRADEAPSWLHELATQAVPKDAALAPAVVLLQETRVAIADDGRVVTTTRKAIKILTSAGKSAARVSQVYMTGASKVRDLNGWVIMPSGKGITVGRVAGGGRSGIFGAAFDRMHSTDPFDSSALYSDVRERGVTAVSQVDPGAVFGYESVTEDHPMFGQLEWYFQGSLPTLVSRLVLTLPSGWRAQSVLSNAPGMVPDVRGSVYTWELHNLPYIEPELFSPPLPSLVPRVLVSYVSSANSAGATQAFGDWKDVSQWLTALSDPEAAPTAEVSAKAQALATNAKTELEKIQSVSRFVQGLKYVSIQTGVGKGGGYRPHPAGDVLSRLYGDCKDKSTLLRAMLKALGMDSFMVNLNSADRTYVRADFPSPEQFDHAIVAVKVSRDLRAAAAADYPAFARLLFIDPTAPLGVGVLPLAEQGGLALVNAGGDGALVRLPMSDPATNVTQSVLGATLAEDGRLTRDLAGGRAGAPYPITSQLVNNRLLIFKPPPPAYASQRPLLTAPTRRYPVVLNPSAYRETLRVKLPPGFIVDELPDSLKREAPFGSYTGSCTKGESEVVFTRNLEIRSAVIPPEQYVEVQEFFQKIADFEQAPVALIRRQ
jgi:hypothetical protein